MGIAERAAIQVKERQDRCCRGHALYQMALVIRPLPCLQQSTRAEYGPV